MSRLWPTAGEAATLRYLLPLGALSTRAMLAGGLFLLGLALVVGLPLALAPAGLLVVLLGHLPLWVRTQTTAPGGATPQHEEVWAPVEEGWLVRVRDLERRGEAWDATPWDVSNTRGCLALAAVGAVLAAGAIATAVAFGGDAAARLVLGAAALLVPLWVNGLRTTWNPSELSKKGEALEVARQAALQRLGADSGMEAVPMLALREGPRGKYPVDARLMLRPAGNETSGFLGVQIQVALNNVQGTDYPYLYAVLLGKEGFPLPAGGPRSPRSGGRVQLVYERGKSEGVIFLVIRQHADKRGGWHTAPEQIREIVEVALAETDAAWWRGRAAEETAP